MDPVALASITAQEETLEFRGCNYPAYITHLTDIYTDTRAGLSERAGDASQVHTLFDTYMHVCFGVWFTYLYTGRVIKERLSCMSTVCLSISIYVSGVVLAHVHRSSSISDEQPWVNPLYGDLYRIVPHTENANEQVRPNYPQRFTTLCNKQRSHGASNVVKETSLVSDASFPCSYNNL